MKRTKTKKPFSTFYEDCESRRTTIADMRQKNPCYTLQQIGDEFGLSRERVRQILKLEGKETKSSDRLIVGKECERCGKTISKKKQYCKQCQFELHHVQVICDQCGEMFWRKVSSVLRYASRKENYDHIFCNRKCFGRWAGKNNGFGKNPPSEQSNLILHNLFVDKYQLVNVTEIPSWKLVCETLSSKEILCFSLDRDIKALRATLSASANRYDVGPVITSIIDGKLYARLK